MRCTIILSALLLAACSSTVLSESSPEQCSEAVQTTGNTAPTSTLGLLQLKQQTDATKSLAQEEEDDEEEEEGAEESQEGEEAEEYDEDGEHEEEEEEEESGEELALAQDEQLSGTRQGKGRRGKGRRPGRPGAKPKPATCVGSKTKKCRRRCRLPKCKPTECLIRTDTCCKIVCQPKPTPAGPQVTQPPAEEEKEEEGGSGGGEKPKEPQKGKCGLKRLPKKSFTRVSKSSGAHLGQARKMWGKRGFTCMSASRKAWCHLGTGPLKDHPKAITYQWSCE